MLFWQLADRWGQMTPEGVVLPLPLTHELLGQLVGLHRPTTSTALQRLTRAGEIARRPDRAAGRCSGPRRSTTECAGRSSRSPPERGRRLLMLGAGRGGPRRAARLAR
jgi:hypothetical protein